jgi:hypothetical protein
LNSLTKFLLEKENFITYFDDESFPNDLAKDGCLALTANVIDESGLLKTRLKVQLKDCRNTMVFESQIGDSKLKAYEKAYQQSIREAFQSFKTLDYSFKPNAEVEVFDDNINYALKMSKKEQASQKSVDKVIMENVENEKHPDAQINQKLSETEKMVNPDTKELVGEKIEFTNLGENILYAQTINNGFQLVDRTPKVVYTIYNSGKKDFYIVKGKDAVIYKLKDIWVISEIVDESLKTESLNIKF